MSNPIVLIFTFAMALIMPFRKLGVFGTPANPRYYNKGDKMPPDVLFIWPPTLHKHAVFVYDVSCYYENGKQVIETLELHTPCSHIVHIGGENNVKNVYAVGAPTFWNNSGNGGDRDKSKDIELVFN